MNLHQTPLNLWDTHMHSQFSGDSSSPLDSMINASIEKGLAGICFTDHLDIDYQDDPDLFLLDLPNYYASVMANQKMYADRLPVLFGIELGLQPHLAALHQDILSQYPFDFVIGSSHVVHGMDPYFPKFYEGRDEKAAYREYFESILENLDAFHDFDVYGHIDYVVRYGPTGNKNYDWTEYEEIINEILKKLIQLGKGIEINTGGFKYGLGHPNPTEAIIRRYKELGGEIITLGADAHSTEYVGFDFEKLPHILKDAGFEYYTIFRQRKPEFLKL